MNNRRKKRIVTPEDFKKVMGVLEEKHAKKLADMERTLQYFRNNNAFLGAKTAERELKISNIAIIIEALRRMGWDIEDKRRESDGKVNHEYWISKEQHELLQSEYALV